MEDLETIFEDTKLWNHFQGEEGETVSVYRRCVECAKYVTKGVLLMNLIWAWASGVQSIYHFHRQFR